MLALFTLILPQGLCGHGVAYDSASYLGMAALLAAGLSVRHLHTRHRALVGVLLGAAALLAEAVALGPAAWITEERVLYTLVMLDAAGVFALGALVLTRPLRASPELRLSVLGTAGLLPVVAASPLVSAVPGRYVAATLVLAFLAWRAVILTRRHAW